MPIKLNQSKVSLRLLKEKNDHIILGEILHYIWELILISKKEIFSISPDSEEFKNKIRLYIQKALAFYQEPLPQRQALLERALEKIEKIFKSEEFKSFKELIEKDKIEAIYKEPEGFFYENEQFQGLRPDIIIKKSNEWIILEFKLHKKFDEVQLKRYLSLLKKMFPNDNIKVYLISFEPFKLELKYSQETQLYESCLLYTSPSPRDLSTSRMPSSA